MTPLRKDFLRRSLLSALTVVLALSFAIGGYIRLHFLQQAQTVLFAKQQAAQHLHAEVETLSAIFGQLPLTVSLAEANTLIERTESQWHTVSEALASLEEAEDMALSLEPVKVHMDRMHKIMNASMSTVIANRSLNTLHSPDSFLSERNQVRLMHAQAVQLAIYASSLSADLESSIGQQKRHVERMTYVLGGLILFSGFVGTLIVSKQFRLLDRRIIQRIEKLSTAMASDTTAGYLKQPPVAVNDEIDLMHRELGAMLVRLDEQKAALELLASTDVLTGLKNRRMVMAALDMEIARTQRHKLPHAVIMLDIDHFKRINDTFGHGGGDTVLKRVGSIIAETVRQTDIAGRYGGEEFLLVLPGTELDGALALAEKLRCNIYAEAFNLDGQGEQHVSASLGVAVAQGEIAKHLLARTDEALYRAKSSGRNQVQVALAGAS